MTEYEAREALHHILKQLGITAGDRIMLAIDMGKIPLPAYSASLSHEGFRERERLWCQFVLDALLDDLTPSGTLLVPSFSYTCTQAKSEYISETTPSENGPFTNFVRVQPKAIRSLHPIFSLTGIGCDAVSLLSNIGSAAFGATSPFGRFNKYQIKFLFLGVELRTSITFAHHMEQVAGCPHRYNKVFDVSVNQSNTNSLGSWCAYVAYRGLNYHANISGLQNALRENGELAEYLWNGYPNHLATTDSCDSIGYELLRRDSFAFVNRKLSLQFDDSSSISANSRNPSTLVVTDTCTDSAV